MTSTYIYTSVIPTPKSKTEKFINKAILIHGELYNYSLVEYIHSHAKIKIVCKIHGMFEQEPTNHLNGQGCKECGWMKISQSKLSNTEDFIIKAQIIYNNKYEYSEVNYIHIHKKVKIICRIHGVFEQTPNNHLYGHCGCTECRHNISKISTSWLKSLNIVDMIFEYRLPENLKKPVDGYSPSTNTVYQFHGDYWHGNPNNKRFKSEDIHPIIKVTYRELYEKTIESDLWIQSLGYNLITIWESRFVILI